tara:strand:- start:705 stop:1802 length:1098 start_codon:yes stop_codon:yes gene_type:complete
MSDFDLNRMLPECTCLPHILAYQHGTRLALRRLVLAPDASRAKRGYGPLRRERAPRHRGMPQRTAAGSLVGVPLGGLLPYCRGADGARHSLRDVLQRARPFLLAAGACVATCSGDDAEHLVQGLACTRVLPAFVKLLPELQSVHAREGDRTVLVQGPLPLDSKYGHNAMALGVAAALLIAFTSLSIDRADTAGLADSCEALLCQACDRLSAWRFYSTPSEHDRRALAAELRAVERALCGWQRGRTLGRGKPDTEQFELALTLFRRAAWPASEAVGEATQDVLLHRIRHGECDVEHPDLTTIERLHIDVGIVPLASCGGLLPRDVDDDAGSVSGSSLACSFSSVSSCSSHGSVGSDVGVDFAVRIS